MITHDIKVYPSKTHLAREDQFAWKIAGVAADKVAIEKDVAAMIVNRIIDNAAVAVASVNRSSATSARGMALADDLRMERDMVRHCFNTRHLGRIGTSSETVEGIRALAVDKDQSPKWLPAAVEEVTAAMVSPFFESPWPAYAHPLRDLR